MSINKFSIKLKKYKIHINKILKLENCIVKNNKNHKQILFKNKAFSTDLQIAMLIS